MEDLVPLIFFLVIVVVNVFKFFIEKGGKAKKPSEQSGEAPPKRASPLEKFFETLAEQMAPQPTELTDWPEDRERPDYAQEMEEFEQVGIEEPMELEVPQSAESIPMPVPYAVRTLPATRSTQTSTQLLKGGEALRSAMLAHIIFSPPRALDPSYSDTFADHN